MSGVDEWEWSGGGEWRGGVGEEGGGGGEEWRGGGWACEERKEEMSGRRGGVGWVGGWDRVVGIVCDA